MALNKTQKTAIWTGVGLALIGGGIFLYYQIKRLLNYSISMNKVKINSFSMDKVELDVFLNFVNKSDLHIELVSQTYDVFLNGAFITKIANDSPNTLAPNSNNVLSFKVLFDPKEVKRRLPVSLIDLVTNFRNQKIRVDFTFRVKFGPFTLPIPYSFEGTPAEWKTF
jgi:LEA14-like dessication related protein